MEIDLYSTHLDVLKKIIGIIGKPDLCIEFGSGDYSTSFLIENAKELISIEMQSEEWYNKMVSKFNGNPNWKHFLSVGPNTYENLDLPTPSLCFVDGHGDSRPECVNLMILKRCPIIVAHDTERESYGWDRIDPKDYLKINFTNHENWTSVWVYDVGLYNKLLS
jgi:hypothetical protein